ncbi:MAG: hypothetical protein IRY87_04015 [Acetobacteraceae bacterium]|nr:hypothetical protein [Acetobacteraceae bacterium]
MSVTVLTLKGGKQGIVLDLRIPDGRADILSESNRPGVMGRPSAVPQAMTGVAFGARMTGDLLRVRVPRIDLIAGIYAS